MGGGARAAAPRRLSAAVHATRHSAATVVIRPAEESDLPAIAEIERRSFSDPWSLRAFGAALARPEVHFTVAQASEGGVARVAGYLVAWFVVDEAEIGNVAVAEEFRGRGVGAALLDGMLAAAGRASVRDVYLEVRESNAAARALYASRGFTPVGRRRRYYRDPVEDALVLNRALAGSGGD